MSNEGDPAEDPREQYARDHPDSTEGRAYRTLGPAKWRQRRRELDQQMADAMAAGMMVQPKQYRGRMLSGKELEAAQEENRLRLEKADRNLAFRFLAGCAVLITLVVAFLVFGRAG